MINWEGCSRKAIQHKNEVIHGGGLLIDLDGMAPIQIVIVSASWYPP